MRATPTTQSSPAWWDLSAASGMDAARHAVWDEPEDRWQTGIDLCLNELMPWLIDRNTILEVGCGVGRLTVPVAQAASGVAYGLDTSSAMLTRAVEADTGRSVAGWFLGTGHDVPPVPMGWHAAYSVVTFQHLDHRTFRRYLRSLAERAASNGVLRFQHVLGGDDGPLNHPLPGMDELHGWLAETGWRLDAQNRDLTYPDWIWVTARKVGL